MIDQLRELANKLEIAALGVAPAIPEVLEPFAWARSVIVCAVCYLPPEKVIDDDVPRGRVARFAQSADYHEVLRAKLERLAEVIRSQYPDTRLEICVDTCPIPERRLAVLGGIAWRGKSGNVFVEDCGSYAALGEIVTDLPLPVSEPLLDDRCGDCELCLRACPTGALTAPYTVDTTRCLSALTQVSGPVPRKLRNNLEDRIYGCDICQQVCPQNECIRPGSVEFAQDLFPGPCPELISLIALTPEQYRDKVKNSSIGWIRRTRIRRNAAIAAGNLRCEAAVPALAQMLSDENALLRAVAAWALGKMDSPEAVQALKNAAATERDETVVEEIRAALSNTDGE